MTKKTTTVQRIKTAVRNLDELFDGGLPKGSTIVIGGPPGSGKTILTQQICFHTASPAQRVLYFGTLSEPTAKTLRYLALFSFFDASKLDEGGIQFVDLGAILREEGLDRASAMVMERVKATNPAIVVIDSFRVFDDLARSREELRKFDYEIVVNLMAWEVTTFLLGEYGKQDIASNPLFSIVDGLILASQREESGEQQRYIQVLKLRGTQHSRDEHAFIITNHGIELFAPRVTLRREDRGPAAGRCKTGVSKFDDLVGAGIPLGSSLLIAGVAGTGKTVLLLEFVYEGAKAGEKGIIFSFEETRERLLSAARGFDWSFDELVASGMIEIVFIAQPEIMVERDLLMMQERVTALKARRIAIDSASVFLHRIKDPQVAREKVFQLASIVQNAQAVGFFATDIPYGANQLSRFGVEETVVDGIVLLSAVEEGNERLRYIEVYKLRNTAHLKGRHDLVIDASGLAIYPRYDAGPPIAEVPVLGARQRISCGIAQLDVLLGGGLLERSVTLISGSAGIGKSTLGLHFVTEGALRNEPGLYIALEERPNQLLSAADGLGLPLRGAVERGMVEILYLTDEYLRPAQFIELLEGKIRARNVRRLVIDSLSQMIHRGAGPEGLRPMLQAMVVRLKIQDATTMLTLESDAMYAVDAQAARGYSPIADNLLTLRYLQTPSGAVPTITVVKTRGSAHDRGTHGFSIGAGGIQLIERTSG